MYVNGASFSICFSLISCCCLPTPFYAVTLLENEVNSRRNRGGCVTGISKEERGRNLLRLIIRASNNAVKKVIGMILEGS